MASAAIIGFLGALPLVAQVTSLPAAWFISAHSRKLAVVAEGVETQTEREMVRRAGCDEAQGYLLGRPEPEAGAL